MTLTAFVAEDEPLARRRLRDLLADVADLVIIGEAHDGPATLQGLQSLKPDLVFLDIQMPGLDGIEVLRRCRPAPAAIFTTAFDRYAVTAFELHAVDYLLKPFGRERLHGAVARVRERGIGGDPAAERLALGGAQRLARIFVRQRGTIVSLPTDTIVRLEARDDYVAVHVPGGRHLVHVALRDLLPRLDPARFVRIHRSHAVNWDQVTALAPGPGGRWVVELRDGTRITASRDRSRALRARAR
jgi:two-component system LytT family response regulator